MILKADIAEYIEYQRGVTRMRRKTYGNVLKAGKLIEKKGYGKKETLEIAVQCFDNLAAMNNGMSVEWLIEKIAPRE